MKKKCFLAAIAFPMLALTAQAQSLPGLPPKGEAAFQDYEKARDHRAFAIAPGGAWGWNGAADSPEEAADKALSACQSGTQQKCVLYARNNQVIFDAKSWPRLWGPYASATVAKAAVDGVEPGKRMPDIAYRDANGRSTQLSKMKGKVVVLHFWGSWCPPCRREMPDLAKLYKALADRRDVVFVLLQIREPFTVAERWAHNQHLELPLADSGSQGENDSLIHLAGDATLNDRTISRSFPTTYVLDKHGLVVFSHVGPVHDWSQYEAFLRDAASRSGK